MIYSFKYAGPFRLCELHCTARANYALMYLFNILRQIFKYYAIEVYPHIGKNCQPLGCRARQNEAG